MNRDELIASLNTIFQRVFEKQDLVVRREMTAADVDNWDSLRHIQLIMEVENFFVVKFKLREVMSLNNVGDLIDLIEKKKA